MYTETNYKSKKAFKDAVKAGQKVRVYQPGGIFPDNIPEQGTVRVAVEGPHYPEPHRWYATAIVTDGYVVRVI